MTSSRVETQTGAMSGRQTVRAWRTVPCSSGALHTSQSAPDLKTHGALLG